MNEKFIVIYGSLFDGVKGAVGPFESEEEAEAYMECHNLGHYEKAVEKLSTP